MPLKTLDPLLGSPALEDSLGTSIAATHHGPHPFKVIEHDILYETEREAVRAQAVLCLAWSLVLNDYQSHSKISFGVLKHSCHHRSLKETILPFHVDLDLQSPIENALAAVEDMGTTLGTKSGSPLASQFQSVLVINEEETTACRENELTGFGEEVANNDVHMTIICRLQNAGIRIKGLLRSTLKFPQSERMMIHQLAYTVKRILSSSSDALLCDVSGVCPEGLEQILGWNDPYSSSAPPPTKDELVHEHFAAICRQQPEATAIDAWNGKLTYGELDRISTIVASRLAHSVRPGSFACVLMEKSMWVSVAMLAVIKAGCAFILLDHAQPDQRLQTICTRSAAAAILCSEQLEQRAAQFGVSCVLCLPLVERESSAAEKLSTDDTAALPPPDALPPASTSLFAIFTSGSTGEPKGVVCNHTSWSSGVARMSSGTYITRETRVFQTASPSFIITPINYLTALHSGACVCVPSEEQLRNDLAGAIREAGATSAIMTPSMARVMDPRDVSSLQTLLLVGEKMTKFDIERWQGLRLLSLYGLSEVVVAGAISHKFSVESDPAEIGKPIATRSWVVCPDDHNKLKPVGASGELLIEGPSTCNKYLNDPEKTNKTYITDPTWCRFISPGAPERRFAKTGDIVRYVGPDGALQYIGRKNTEVKLRGQRMDLSEVEYHVQQQFHDGTEVAAEVVLPKNGVLSEHAMLVAFISVQQKQGARRVVDFVLARTTPEFKRKAQQAITQLKQSLPSFMVPTAFVSLEHLPLTASGKLNRLILRESASNMSREEILSCSQDVSATKTQAATAEEAILQNACAQVLAQPAETVDVESSFSTLGMDSLGARHVVSICRQQGLLLNVADVFNAASIQELAGTCSSRDIGQYSNPLTDDQFGLLQSDFLSSPQVPLVGGANIEAVFPTLLAQSRAAKAIDYFLVHLSGDFEQDRFNQACETLVQSHVPLRTLFVPFNDQLLNVVFRQLAPDINHHVVSTGTDLAHWAREFCLQDLHKPHPPHEPVVKFLVGAHADLPQSRVLIIRLNHASFDGSCVWRIISDLGLAYEGSRIEVASDFPQFARQTFQQRKLQQSSSKVYWTKLLTDATITPLPVSQVADNRDKRATPTFVTRHLPVQSPPPQGISMATVAKAAWSYVLRKHMGTDDVLFAQVINCRDVVILPGAEDVLGSCHNFSPVRVRYPVAPQSPDSIRILQDLQEQHAQSLTHCSLDWEDVASNCTSWPVNTMPTFYLAYQDLRQFSDQEYGGLSIRFGEHVCDHSPPGEAWLAVTPVDNALRVDFGTMSSAMEQETAEIWISDFCECITALLEGVPLK
ncbi:uncharacterized protein N7529_008586 [Penicillium soppii]|uniref:uncharacterized protein n=1 Tax=Penicillium soppii TaxID=69789 RepID=UPI002546E017|nr:uncharacterized protein N7529_008586 [Penicillium soppii]KAJ5861276.1 hypothetical protein N7529_008586 [Penicillium soppii]